jgi:nicotinic acid mononucleotide adenylyltransferase
MIIIFLLLIFTWITPAHALVLEDIIQNGSLETTLKDKKIGYFVGSFDPVHKAHEALAESPLNQGLCDFVIVYPAWGCDQYKVRSDIHLRLDMLFSLFKNHPKIIVTRLTPEKLQQALTKKIDGKENRTPAFEGTSFIGILGADTALYLATNPETSVVYMTGLEIPEKYHTHTWGSCMALPVDSFIVALREGSDISSLAGKLRERPIITTFEHEKTRTISSTDLKKDLKNSEPLDSTVSAPIIDIIEKKQLYR